MSLSPGRAGCALVAAALACVVTALSVLTDFDPSISDAIFAGAGRWPVAHEPGLLRIVFYDGPTWLLGLFALWIAAGSLRPALVRRLGLSGPEARYVLVCLAVVPLLIGALKHLSGVACAYDLARYGGTVDDALGRFPFSHTGAGSCWPAAHPSGAFALLGLGLLPRPLRTRRRLWFLAFALGTALGTYQVLRGAHFTSHVIVTALLAQALACLLAFALLARSQGSMTSSPPM